MEPDEKELALSMLDDGMSISDVAYKLGRAPSSISRLKSGYSSTAKLATRLIRANAEKLAKRVVDHATVEEAIQVLSRPNIDVLKPPSRNDGNTGIFISVGAGSLGAFKDAPDEPITFDVESTPVPDTPRELPAAVPEVAAKPSRAPHVSKPQKGRPKRSAIHLNYEVEGLTDAS